MFKLTHVTFEFGKKQILFTVKEDTLIVHVHPEATQRVKTRDDLLLPPDRHQFAYDVWRSLQPEPNQYPVLVAKFVADGEFAKERYRETMMCTGIRGSMYGASRTYTMQWKQIDRLISAIEELLNL